MLTVDQHGGGAPGVQEATGRHRAHIPVDAERREQPGEHALGGEEVGRRRIGVAPGCRTHRAGEDRADVVRLLRQAVGLDGDPRPVDGAGLEQRDPAPARAPSAVARGHVQQRAKQRGPQLRLLRGHRVGERQRAARAGLEQPQLVRELRACEAPADDLVQPLRGERVLGVAPQPLHRRQPPDGAVTGGQRRRQVLEAIEPRDLLDQVGLARDVIATEVGDGHIEPVGGVDGREGERLQQLLGALARDRDAEQALDARVAQADRGGLRPGPADIDRARADGRATDVDEQSRRDRLCPQRLLGLQPLLIAARGLAAQRQLERGGMDVGAVPGRDLADDGRGRVRDLGAGAAHHTGN